MRVNRICLVVLVACLSACGPAIKDLHNLQTSQAVQDQQLTQLRADLETQKLQYIALEQAVEGNTAAIAQIQIALMGINVRLAALEGYSNIVQVIDVCGDNASRVDEVLLKMSDNSILASFSDSASGANTRFSILAPGNYVTSDGTNCAFTVQSDFSVTW